MPKAFSFQSMYRAHTAPGAAWVAGLVVALAIVSAAVAGCGGPAGKPGCASDKDCKANQVCATGRCLECVRDDQCGAGKACVANACITAECTGPDCKPGDAAGKACAKNEDCADDEDCIDGRCRRAGQPIDPSTISCALATVYFAYDDSTVASGERDRLAANAACIESVAGKNVYVVGHTDTSGTDEYNIALSERRAQTVADYLSRLGSDPARLQVVPKGETEPTGQGDARDRRVEFQWH